MTRMVLGIGLMWIFWLLYFFKYHLDLGKLLTELGAEVDRLTDEVNGIYEMMWESGIGEEEENDDEMKENNE